LIICKQRTTAFSFNTYTTGDALEVSSSFICNFHDKVDKNPNIFY